MEAKQTPLIELLERVPQNARCRVDEPDGMGSVFIPVGKLCHEAAAALRAALAQEQDAELSAALGWPGGISEPVLDRGELLRMVATLAQAQAEPVQEPVAWMIYMLDGKSVCVTDNPADFTNQHRALPLYTARPSARRTTMNDLRTAAQQAHLVAAAKDKEIERLQVALTEAHAVREACNQRAFRLEAEIDRLREALKKYGQHRNDCAVTLGGYQCTCGFNQQEQPK